MSTKALSDRDFYAFECAALRIGGDVAAAFGLAFNNTLLADCGNLRIACLVAQGSVHPYLAFALFDLFSLQLQSLTYPELPGFVEITDFLIETPL